MISFGIMTTLLVALAFLVHYDLLGRFLDYPHARRIVYIDNGQRQHQPRSEFDHIWIPRPGTDPNSLYFLPTPVTLQDPGPGGKDEGYWTDSDDDVGDAHNNRDTTGDRLSVDDAHQREPAPDTVVDGVPITTTTEVTDDRDDDNQNYSDDDYYVAPGQEWDDDVF